MKTHHSKFAALMALAAPILLAGCDTFKKPDPVPQPTPVPEPKAGLFDPAQYNVPGIDLSKANDPKLPDHYEVSVVYSGNLIALRSVDYPPPPAPPKNSKGAAPAPTPTGTPAPQYGVPVVMRLAGISVPDPRNPNLPARIGAADSIRTVTSWLRDPKTGRPRPLSVQQDSKYPVDFDSDDLDEINVKRAPRVQVFFAGPDPTTPLNLNRLMVRSGYAVVNEHEPTIFDTKGWLNDEEYARQNHLGLWKLGIYLNERQPPPPKAKPGTTPTPAPGAPAAGAAATPAPGAPAPGAATTPTPATP